MKASKAAKVARTRLPLGTAPVERAEPRPDPQWWGYPVAVVLAPLVFFADGILGRVVYAFGDGIELFVPWFMVSARAWRSGHLPTWNPWAQAGMPHLGASQAGALYLPNLLWLVASPAVADPHLLAPLAASWAVVSSPIRAIVAASAASSAPGSELLLGCPKLTVATPSAIPAWTTPAASPSMFSASGTGSRSSR